MKRRRPLTSAATLLSIAVLCVMAIVAGVVSLAGCGTAADGTTASESSTTSTTDHIAEALAFPVDSYSVQVKEVATPGGTVSVEYHLYQHLTYVADPVDADYQSLDVAVPVKIDDRDVDATNAPILLHIAVDSYLSSPNLSPVTRTNLSATTTTAVTDKTTDDTIAEVTTSLPSTTVAFDTNTDLALAAGYVVVSPGCRGSENVAANGGYYGKAPAAIVDLKCAVKYIRFNDNVMPGNAGWIIAEGCGAGGALSALLGASGNSELYQSYFDRLGAADAADCVYASAAYCPITDLDHADGAYEWQFGTTALDSGLVDQNLSAQLASGFASYLNSLDLVGVSGFGSINADNYGDYIVQTYLTPAVKTYLDSLPEERRETYLAQHRWIGWNGSITFAWKDYVTHVGRTKDLPAFDAFDLSTPECLLFGDTSTAARHFTEFSLRQTGEGLGPAIDVDLQEATLDSDLQTVVNLMNPMYFVTANYSGCTHYWWIRQGTDDSEVSLAVTIDLAVSLENLGKEVNTALYWETDHAANEDPADFVEWIDLITSTGG